MNLLFIGAHPDDLEILCGGTIAKCVSEGHEVWMAVSTNGNVGSPTLSRPEIGAIRKEEATAAARTLGAAGLIWIDEDDGNLFYNERTRTKFIDAIRRARAEVIIAHNSGDYHPDHVISSRCATDARLLATVRLIATTHPALPKQPDLFYMDSIAGVGFSPSYYVDISETFDLKMKALQCHQSQNTWMMSLYQQDLGEISRIQSAFRGLQVRAAYAEAFSQPDGWPRNPVPPPFLR